MYSIDLTGIPASALPITEFREHLRLGTGFTDDAHQDALLERALTAAILQIEASCGKALVRRQFRWSTAAWRDLGRQTLPMAPLETVDLLEIKEFDGTGEVIAADRYHVDRDLHRPSIVSRGFVLPSVPVGGRAEITFTAGYGATWSGVPGDLALAAMMLAAMRYEDRTGGVAAIPVAVDAMLSPYRPMRLLGGRI